MDGPSNLQIVAAVILSWVAIFVFSWQLCISSRVEKKTRCPWVKCKHNKDCQCQCNEVDLTTLIWDDHLEGLRCESFEQGEEEHGQAYNKIV